MTRPLALDAHLTDKSKVHMRDLGTEENGFKPSAKIFQISAKYFAWSMIHPCVTFIKYVQRKDLIFQVTFVVFQIL